MKHWNQASSAQPNGLEGFGIRKPVSRFIIVWTAMDSIDLVSIDVMSDDSEPSV